MFILRKSSFFKAIPLIVILIFSCNVWPQTGLNYRALLIGVSSYPNLPSHLQLKGPKNDVARMRDLLITRGFDGKNIHMLADGVPDAELPTRNAILSSLNELALTAKPNDYIVILLGGHGSQQPVPKNHPHAGEEPDGLFEIFLPRDVESWTRTAGRAKAEVPNAILDHEIRAHVDRMTAKGAFVWAIFDTCHSATMVRSGIDSEVRLRQVTMAELGIPKEEFNRAGASSNSQHPRSSVAVAGSTSPGQAVYFYAAQTHEPAPEASLPYGMPNSVPHGLFSYSVMQTLESFNRPMSYEQLGQQVLTRYAALVGNQRSSPLFTGNALKSGLLGQKYVPHRQWLIRRDEKTIYIPAGALSEVNESSIFAVLPDALSRSEEAIGYVKVSKATATSAQLESIALHGKPALTQAQLSAGSVVRLIQQGAQFTLNVGVDLSECSQPCNFKEPLDELSKQSNGGVPGANVRWLSRGQGADLVLKADGHRLWLLPTIAAQVPLPEFPDKHFLHLNSNYKSASPSSIKRDISVYLQQASKAINLIKIATAVENTTPTKALKIDLKFISDGFERPLQKATVKPSDKIRVTMRNTERRPLDVTALYIDSQHGVSVFFPSGDSSNRIGRGDELSFEIKFNDSTLGLEHLAIVAVEAKEQGENVNFSFLAQDRLPTRGPIRGDTDVIDFFTDAGFATHVTRGDKAKTPPSSTGMQIHTFLVKP